MIFPLIITITILIFFFIYKNKKENFDYVVPRYYEDLNWVTKYPDLNFFIYNRGKPNIRVISLPNNGRDCHTILYHIINNYHNLGEVTIFGANNSSDYRRYSKVNKTIELVRKTNNTVFICESIINNIKNFKISAYKSTNINNVTNEEEKDKNMILSDIRPFDTWYKSIWPDSPVNWVCYLCIFAVHKNHIIQHPLSYYEKLIQGLEHVNTELCHYMERAFTTVFYPYPLSCVYNHTY